MSDGNQTWEAVRLNQTCRKETGRLGQTRPEEEESCLLLASFGALACMHELQLSHLGSLATSTGVAVILIFLPLPPPSVQWNRVSVTWEPWTVTDNCRKSKPAGRELGLSQDGGRVGSLIPLEPISQEEPRGSKCVNRQISFNVLKLLIM